MKTYLSRTLEQFFLTVGQNNFGNKIPFAIAASACKIVPTDKRG